MPVEKIVKIAGYLALLGLVSFAWIEIAGKVHSEVTERIKEELQKEIS